MIQVSGSTRKNSIRIITILLLIIMACLTIFIFNVNIEPQKTATPSIPNIPVYNIKIINSYPHDQKAFTQGLVYDNGYLYEGTGLYGQSSLKKIDLETGTILLIHNLSNHHFGEGIAIFGDKILQLTRKNNVVFVYDKENFQKISDFNYPNEGWGITHDNEHLILSDGTSTIYFIDPETFEVVRKMQVFSKKGPVKHLNELEYIKGEIYANIWQTNLIAIISPTTGEVTGWIDVTELQDKEDSNPSSIPNGIAYDHKNNRLFVTGKLWSRIFEIELVLTEKIEVLN